MKYRTPHSRRGVFWFFFTIGWLTLSTFLFWFLYANVVRRIDFVCEKIENMEEFLLELLDQLCELIDQLTVKIDTYRECVEFTCENFPGFIESVMIYRGKWDADANFPTLLNGTGGDGDTYIVDVAGNTTLDGNTEWQPGDIIIFDEDAGIWCKNDGSPENIVVPPVIVSNLTDSGNGVSLIIDGEGPVWDIHQLKGTDITITDVGSALELNIAGIVLGTSTSNRWFPDVRITFSSTPGNINVGVSEDYADYIREDNIVIFRIYGEISWINPNNLTIVEINLPIARTSGNFVDETKGGAVFTAADLNPPALEEIERTQLSTFIPVPGTETLECSFRTKAFTGDHRFAIVGGYSLLN